MGLAGTKVKQRFGLDPRNTNWANDTSRFGHQYMQKLGWEQGQGLGLVQHAMTTHVKVTIRGDNEGLGARLAKKQKKDGIEQGDAFGLDLFQRLLGRLNGKEEEIATELDRQRKDNWLSGKWGMHFVKGEVLNSTWDAESKKLKRKADEIEEKLLEEVLKRDKKQKKEEKKERKERRENGNETSEDKKERKREKKEKKELKKEKKEKKVEAKERLVAQAPTTATAMAGRLAGRSRWIRQKRASVMDAQALNEIFMISNK